MIKRSLIWGAAGACALALSLGGVLTAFAPAGPAPAAVESTRVDVVTLHVAPSVLAREVGHSAQAPVVAPHTEKTGAVPPPPPPPPPPPTPAVPGCPQNATGGAAGAPGIVSAGGVGGTTSSDIIDFAAAFNAIRVAHCLPAVPFANFRYDSCMEARLFWIAEDPSTDITSAWGHIGSVRSDGLPSVGCDGNLAGGMNNTSVRFAEKWWESVSHRNSLYRPADTGLTSDVCIYFAMTHGGVPDEPYAFTRGAARWDAC